jgi:uncharacterized protein (DUF433 family)
MALALAGIRSDLLEAYPRLTEDDIRAALAFAADYMQHETILAAE